MKFGVYIHIPFCLQKCHYCDFITMDLDSKISTDDYVQIIKKEILERSHFIKSKQIDTIYFGGGTPSLIPPKDILNIIDTFEKAGFQIKEHAEVTIEINPGTLNKNDLDLYLSHKVNRFSLGAQTFNSKLLASTKREHSVNETLDSLEILKSRNSNFSFDLLFALPHQDVPMLEQDLEMISKFKPPHVSTYCLNIPKKHAMAFNRAPDEQQSVMFDVIEDQLKKQNIFQYEISNFASNGFESQHNILYWSNDCYWGLGLGAHSYFPEEGTWGTRFWNPPTIKKYSEQINSLPGIEFLAHLPEKQKEVLNRHEALSDYCHTHLRMNRGLNDKVTHDVFSLPCGFIENHLQESLENGLVENKKGYWVLTKKGRKLSNRVFFDLTFLSDSLTFK